MTMSPPHIMGILNCTPDSFSDGGFYSTDELVARGLKMVEEGADWIDVGGESTRPGATPVSADEELRRVIPVIRGLKGNQISIDTTKSEVAEMALDVGATLVNDVSGMDVDPRMRDVVRRYKADVIIMHSRGTPQTMSDRAIYKDVVAEVKQELTEKISRALEAGISKEKILIDPGFGFAKNFEQNISLLKNLSALTCLGFPLVVGVSRKSFIGTLIDEPDPKNRLIGSLAAALFAVKEGATLLRVHDVAPTVQACRAFLLS